MQSPPSCTRPYTLFASTTRFRSDGPAGVHEWLDALLRRPCDSANLCHAARYVGATRRAAAGGSHHAAARRGPRPFGCQCGAAHVRRIVMAAMLSLLAMPAIAGKQIGRAHV